MRAMAVNSNEVTWTGGREKTSLSPTEELLLCCFFFFLEGNEGEGVGEKEKKKKLVL